MQSARRRIEEELYRAISLLPYVPFVCLFYATIRVRLTVLANIQSLFYSCICLQKTTTNLKVKTICMRVYIWICGKPIEYCQHLAIKYQLLFIHTIADCSTPRMRDKSIISALVSRMIFNLN